MTFRVLGKFISKCLTLLYTSLGQKLIVVEYRTYVMVDENQDLVVMTVYNMVENTIKVSDYVVIPNAKVGLVSIELPKNKGADGTPGEPSKDDISLKYPSIRVENPMSLLVNSLKLDKASFVRAQANS